jgi:hypothetical protein
LESISYTSGACYSKGSMFFARHNLRSPLINGLSFSRVEMLDLMDPQSLSSMKSTSNSHSGVYKVCNTDARAYKTPSPP